MFFIKFGKGYSFSPLLWDSHYVYVGAYDGVSQIWDCISLFLYFFIYLLPLFICYLYLFVYFFVSLFLCFCISLFLRQENLNWFIFKFAVSSFWQLNLLLATILNFSHFSHSIFQFQKISLILLYILICLWIFRFWWNVILVISFSSLDLKPDLTLVSRTHL